MGGHLLALQDVVGKIPAFCYQKEKNVSYKNIFGFFYGLLGGCLFFLEERNCVCRRSEILNTSRVRSA